MVNIFFLAVRLCPAFGETFCDIMDILLRTGWMKRGSKRGKLVNEGCHSFPGSRAIGPQNVGTRVY